MNGLDYKFFDGGMTTVLTEGEQYLGILSEFGSSSSIDESYDIGLKSEPESVSWQPQDTAADKKLREKFNNLAETWEKETEFVSSINDIIIHPAHMQIIGMGPKTVPLIFDRMQKESGLWFWALEFITGENPVTEDIRGNIQAMSQAWLDWGWENGQL